MDFKGSDDALTVGTICLFQRELFERHLGYKLGTVENQLGTRGFPPAERAFSARNLNKSHKTRVEADTAAGQFAVKPDR